MTSGADGNKTGRGLPLRYAMALVAVMSFIGVTIASHVNFTTTGSVKHRFYFLSDLPEGTIERGSYVMFEMPERARKILLTEKKVTSTKRVGCTAGDTLTTDDTKSFYCNGDYLGRAKDRSMDNRPLTMFVYNGTVPPGKLFVVGDHKDSFDSRYYGFIDRTEVTRRATPLF